MQFLKSLFCLHGFDNRTRFFAISSGVYVLFSMLASALTNSIFISLMLLVVFSIILGLTSLRRLHDAKFNKKWFFAPSLTFTLTGIIIILSEQSSSYYLLIIPTLCTAILLTYQSHTKKKYILGYYGPVDMSEYQQDNNQSKQSQYRIEPTLVSKNTTNYYYSEDDDIQTFNQTSKTENNDHSQNQNRSDKETDIGELIRLNLLNNRKAQLIIVAVIGITLIGVTTSWLINYLDSSDDAVIKEDDNKPKNSTFSSILRNHPLPMPDNYTLYLSDHSGISINWQADEVETSLLWSQQTAQGDTSCKEISFNKGTPIRTLSVQVEKSDGINTSYFANFSPLDSQELIQALAFRGDFTLCGYNFSLKGSQAALATNKQYAQWVEY
ncbi:hypothetical protein [Colwellia sp. 20A7]|uniref:hypothetical protein n=1 Tax=Colwellia sp. 20A7 TaxID=2689569 RepID=UPI001357BCE5|nr:hypothetical protein [Colwellia sp. 20A7]